MDDAVGFAIRLVNAKEFERVIQGGPFGALAFEQPGRVADDFRRVIEEKKSLIERRAQRAARSGSRSQIATRSTGAKTKVG
jgi:hypothetical protein